MKTRGRRRGSVIPAIAAAFCVGMLAGWFLKSGGAPQPAAMLTTPVGRILSDPATNPVGRLSGPAGAPGEAGNVVATTGEPLIGPDAPAPLPAAAVMDLLRNRNLRLPIDDADGDAVESMRGDFEERRGAGDRGHEAVDILAPRNTPVHAVDDGTIAKLFNSEAGGITLYQFDPTGRFCYYYAHLEQYADGVKEGQRVARGQVIGFVGTSGNAPPNTPHLHFAVFELDVERHWWKGRALDPYLIFRP